MGETSMIDCFLGEYAFLSNFAYSPFVIEGIRFNTVEHYYQAQKTFDIDSAAAIICAKTPSEAKRLGQLCPMRDDWQQIRLDVMSQALSLKFAPHTTFAQ